jgi:hypothetical protein
MRIYVNAGFGDCLGAQTLRWIRNHGFAGIRQEVFRGQDTEPIIREIAESDLDAILLLCGAQMERISFNDTVDLARHVAIVARDVVGIDIARLAIEIGNEPDLACNEYKYHPEEFARLVRESATSIWAEVPTMSVISGGVSNTHRDGLDYLDSASRAGFPDRCQVGYHSYHTKTAPEIPHDHFRSRREEFDRLRRIVGNRQMWCTEVGWHTYPSRIAARLWPPRAPKTVQFTDDQVAEFTARELVLHRDAGAVCAAVFQLNDADIDPPTSYEHRHGIRFVNGDPKPVALRIREIAAALA